MPNPVVHFEIIGKDGKKLQSFYSGVFGWGVDASNPMEYGMVEAPGSGIGGGISKGQADEHLVTVYVEVDDLQATLDKATSMGGKVIMPPTEIPGAVTMAQFEDPEGNLIGLIKSGSM
ncbi:MAG TPA: VOC family protein [Dehalococcoidia bacterium]|nr:VOC family protein [Dehalococcoidia bacterium]